MNPAIIAHRGASFLAKHENTLESFQLAIDIGADYVEFDIRQTRDRCLIVFHDNTLDGIKLSDMTYEELCRKTEILGYKPPLLVDVLKLCRGKIKLDIELKESGYESSIISIVKEFFDYDDFMMKSFLDTSVARIKVLDQHITTGLLLGMYKGDFKRRIHEYFPERRLKSCHADFVSPNYQLATREFIHRMHAKHKKVYVWTINDASLIGKFINRNVDGIITDKPDAGLFIRKGFLL
ncbi:MAG: glycerophosphodiester phosphodiesterase [Eubacteriales bacterium]|nr:glycerophosphodiester phosphodiesterase [Lachnospiraceae bacterium]MDO5127370.1 glycerophosphodiester phosphodiesterase [Eubacteriales bacterium]